MKRNGNLLNAHLVCAHCGANVRRLEGTARRVIATCFGLLSLPRRFLEFKDER